MSDEHNPAQLVTQLSTGAGYLKGAYSQGNVPVTVSESGKEKAERLKRAREEETKLAVIIVLHHPIKFINLKLILLYLRMNCAVLLRD